MSPRKKMTVLVQEENDCARVKTIVYNIWDDNGGPCDQKGWLPRKISMANTCRKDANQQAHIPHSLVKRGSYCAARPGASVLARSCGQINDVVVATHSSS
jgi:hypothetical protein